MTNLLLAAEHSSGELLLMALLAILFWGTIVFLIVKFGLIVLKAIVSFFLPYWLD